MGKKNATITSFFKRKDEEKDKNLDTENQPEKRHKASTSGDNVNDIDVDVCETVNIEVDKENEENQQGPSVPETPQPNINVIDPDSLERDPAKRIEMWKYSVNQRELVRRAYVSLGAYQIKLTKYKPRGPKHNLRRFKYAWFGEFPNWLEYSPTTHKAYCFLCYLYTDKLSENHGYNAFTTIGFDNWKKVNDGNNCPFVNHLKTTRHK